MKLLTLFALFILVATSANAHLSDYPSHFIQYGSFGGQIIVGADAPSTDALAAAEIATSLQQQSSTLITANTDDEFNPSESAILIGLPCHNTATAQVLETDECDIGLEKGQGLLKLLEGSATYLIVTGSTAADTRKAARFLANNELSSLETHEIRVEGTLDSPIAKESEPLTIKKTPAKTAEAECETDNDCREDQSCIATKCIDLGCWEGTIAKNHDCVPIAAEAEHAEKQQPGKTAAEITEEPEAKPEQAEKQGFIAKLVDFFLSLFY
jgi:hypothetical protein